MLVNFISSNVNNSEIFLSGCYIIYIIIYFDLIVNVFDLVVVLCWKF